MVGLAVVVGVAKTQSQAGASIPLGALAHHRDERQAGALATAVALDAVLVVELPSLFFHSDLDGPRVREDFIIAHHATVCGFWRKVGLELVEVGLFGLLLLPSLVEPAEFRPLVSRNLCLEGLRHRDARGVALVFLWNLDAPLAQIQVHAPGWNIIEGFRLGGLGRTDYEQMLTPAHGVGAHPEGQNVRLPSRNSVLKYEQPAALFSRVKGQLH